MQLGHTRTYTYFWGKGAEPIVQVWKEEDKHSSLLDRI